MYLHAGFINTAEVEKAVDEFLKTLGPEVVSLRYNLGKDWMGDPALHFHVDAVAADMKTFTDTAAAI